MLNTHGRSRIRCFPPMIATLALVFSSAAFAQHYQQTDLVTDSSSISSTATIDPNLVNAWGLSRASGSPWWVSDNGTGLSTLYDGTGAIVQLVVTIPPPMGGTPPSAPTGTVYNFTGRFRLKPGKPSVFLFATEDGTIAGWNPGVDPTNAVIKVDNSKQGAIYKGCAIAKHLTSVRLYATNFATGQVEMYDGNFQPVAMASAFQDANLPANYAPFGIQNVGGNIVVTFAHRKPGSKDEDHGNGLGYVDVFDFDGNLLLRLEHGPFLNAPWGIALAPGDFGTFSHRLLIGNFGDGRIHAFNLVSGMKEGTLLNADGTPLWIDGLWALSFGGDGAKNGLATELFFTAGPNDENDGLYGKITPAAAEQRGNSE
jgi:uncharacterized protein (TIGR03118 family)